MGQNEKCLLVLMSHLFGLKTTEYIFMLLERVSIFLNILNNHISTTKLPPNEKNVFKINVA